MSSEWLDTMISFTNSKSKIKNGKTLNARVAHHYISHCPNNGTGKNSKERCWKLRRVHNMYTHSQTLAEYRTNSRLAGPSWAYRVWHQLLLVPLETPNRLNQKHRSRPQMAAEPGHGVHIPSALWISNKLSSSHVEIPFDLVERDDLAQLQGDRNRKILQWLQSKWYLCSPCNPLCHLF